MNPLNKIINLVRPKAKNSMSISDEFLRYGNRRTLKPDWAEVMLSDKDSYTGYSYAMINRRASKVASTATDGVTTDYLVEGEDLEKHPYLDLIENSTEFSEYEFWNNISVYLDLEGIYYLMAVRGVSDSGVYGDITKFGLINPYNIKPVYNKDTGELGGYTETRGNMVREIPKDMIIMIKELNPFDNAKPYSIVDAAKETQYSIRSTGNYTREAISQNINAPGILATGVQLEEEQFRNFQSRIREHNHGEPIFANGAQSVTWEAMQHNLKDAALSEINEINRDTLFSVGGVSKTIMGIEQSGTTRDTARVQKELSMEDHILPRIQKILDTLNLDYRKNYSREYEKANKPYLVIHNPLAVDYEAGVKATELKGKQLDLYVKLRGLGADAELAAKYVNDDASVEDLNDTELAPPEQPEAEEEQAENHVHNDVLSGMVTQQEAALKNAVVTVESQLAAEAVKNIEKLFVENQLDSETDLISKKAQRDAENELNIIMVGFYISIFGYVGNLVMRKRLQEFQMTGIFTVDSTARAWIKQMSKKLATSHVSTVVNDLYETARKAALEGKSRSQIVSELTTEYQDITKNRATAVARSETNRAFTRSQYEADRQFIKQNELSGRAYKQLRTRSDNPCVYCKAIEAEGLIPFDQAFRSIGDGISVDGKELTVEYEDIEAGNVHTNCSCSYDLIILPE